MNGVQVEDSLVHVSSEGAAEIFVVNTSGLTCAVHEGEIVGRATEVEVERADMVFEYWEFEMTPTVRMTKEKSVSIRGNSSLLEEPEIV